MAVLWGIDLGGTKIEGVIIEDNQNLNVLKRLRVPTEANKGYEHICGQIIKLVEVLMAETGTKPDKIGIGTPGALDPATQLMKNANTTALIGKPLKKDLESILKVPIQIANDANCFAVAEANLGAVKDHLSNPEVVFGVIMGTGVGGGVVVNGKVINGRHSIGGEWGHNLLEPNGQKCYCGRLGCVETVFSGPALERYYQSVGGATIKMPDIYKNYKNGNDEAAQLTMKRLLENFGKAIANIINILDPDAIVIGGGVGNIDEIYTLGVEEAKKHVFNPRLDTLFLKPKLGDSAGVFGAALL